MKLRKIEPAYRGRTLLRLKKAACSPIEASSTPKDTSTSNSAGEVRHFMVKTSNA